MPRKWLTRRVTCTMMAAMTALVLVQTIRLAVLNLVLPTPWADTDKVHLLQVITTRQELEVNRYPLVRSRYWDLVQVNISRLAELTRTREIFYQQFNDRFTHHQNLQNGQFEHRLDVIDQFKPIMTAAESASLIFTLETFAHACRTAHLQFFMTEASLMGVTRHHGLVPWDDDVDVAMNIRQWRETRDVLGDIRGFELYAPNDSQWKFFMSSAAVFPDKPFKFPYLDIFFYDEDSTHIWAVTKGLKHDLVYRKSDIFPLLYRPFEHLTVPVPCNLDLVVHRSHDQNECVTPEYIHKTNTNFYYGGKTTVHCGVLHDIYPFVFSTDSEVPGYREEYLKVGTEVLHKRTVPHGCPDLNTAVLNM